jgi:hypothetical protein
VAAVGRRPRGAEDNGVSGYVTGWVLKHSDAQGAARLVLIVLADHASSDGTNSWPSVDTIQHEARLKSRRSVQNSLRQLEDAGAIVADGQGAKGQTNWTVVVGAHEMRSAIDDAEGRNLRPEGGATDAPKPSFNHPEPPCVGSASDEAVEVPVQRQLGEDGKPVPLLSPDGEIESVWEHYVEVMAPRHKQLAAAERALIRDALKVATAVECKQAIDGCRASAFHMGENDRGKKYNRLSQILKGKRGIRTTREQIDLFLDIAEKAGVGPGSSSVDPARLAEAKRNVLTAWEFPRSGQAKELGDMSAAWLAQHGYRVDHDPESGRPTFVFESER